MVRHLLAGRPGLDHASAHHQSPGRAWREPTSSAAIKLIVFCASVAPSPKEAAASRDPVGVPQGLGVGGHLYTCRNHATANIAAWLDDNGMPTYQVAYFQAIAAISAEKITATLSELVLTTLATVLATAVPTTKYALN
jgi:hypothetical protein